MSTDFKNRLSRRQFLSSSIRGGIRAAVGMSATFSAAQQRAAGTVEELVLINGRIHTMDRNNTIVQWHGQAHRSREGSVLQFEGYVRSTTRPPQH